MGILTNSLNNSEFSNYLSYPVLNVTVRSGINFNLNFSILLLDQFLQKTFIPTTTKIKMKLLNKNKEETNLAVIGITELFDQNGVVNFLNLQTFGNYGEDYYLEISCDELPIYTNLNIAKAIKSDLFQFEQLDMNNHSQILIDSDVEIKTSQNYPSCEKYASGTYTWDRKNCITCENGANCEDDILNLNKGYWRKNSL